VSQSYFADVMNLIYEFNEKYGHPPVTITLASQGVWDSCQPDLNDSSLIEIYPLTFKMFEALQVDINPKSKPDRIQLS
jgi:hypothetical protein